MYIYEHSKKIDKIMKEIREILKCNIGDEKKAIEKIIKDNQIMQENINKINEYFEKEK